MARLPTESESAEDVRRMSEKYLALEAHRATRGFDSPAAQGSPRPFLPSKKARQLLAGAWNSANSQVFVGITEQACVVVPTDMEGS